MSGTENTGFSRACIFCVITLGRGSLILGAGFSSTGGIGAITSGGLGGAKLTSIARGGGEEAVFICMLGSAKNKMKA